jgi:gluconolactonase
MDSPDVVSLIEGLDHPEGVAWGRDGCLYAGGEAGQLYRVDIDTLVVDQFATTGGFILGIALDADSTVFACDSKRKAVMRVGKDGRASIYSSGSADRTMTTPNFPVFASSGLMYVSDSGTWEGDDGCIYAINPSGEAEVWSEEICGFPNGLALDAGEDYLYVAESTGRCVSRLPILSDGRAGPRELVVELRGTVPDGLAFDAEGGLLVSCYRPDRIYRFLPSGHLTILAEDPDGTSLAAPTNVCFGGNDLARLFSANLGRWHISEVSVPFSGAPLKYPSLPGVRNV